MTAIDLLEVFLTVTVEIQIHIVPGRVVINHFTGIQRNGGTVQWDDFSFDGGSTDLLHIRGQFTGTQIQFGNADLVFTGTVGGICKTCKERSKNRFFCGIGIQRKDDVCRVIQCRFEAEVDRGGEVIVRASAAVVFAFQHPGTLPHPTDGNVGGVDGGDYIKGDGIDGLNTGL